MADAITWAQIGTLIALIGGFFAIYRWISGIQIELLAKIAETKAELADYKLVVAERYVSAVTAGASENRLLVAFDKLSARMEGIVARLDKLALTMAAGFKKTNGDSA